MLSVAVIALNSYYDGLQREHQLYQYLLGNGASHLEAITPFVRKSVENGIDIIRIFDALNDKRNLKVAIDAAKKEKLADYYGFTYCIYKEDKPKKEVTEREEDGKKIVETREIPGAAMLLEVITVDENGVTIK